VLQKANWPDAEDKHILFGDRKVTELTKMVKLDIRHVSSVMRQFRMIKDGCVSEAEENEFKELN